MGGLLSGLAYLCIQTKNLSKKSPSINHKLPGKAQVERHIRGKWVCKECETLAHARRKFYELHVANKSEIAAQALASFKALDYSLKRWAALTRYLEDGCVPIDNNHIEQQIRPLALGRKNWLFAGSLRAGQRAAAVMTLIQSAKLNGHDPYAYLKDVLTRLPTHPNHRIHELLPHHWQPAEQ